MQLERERENCYHSSLVVYRSTKKKGLIASLFHCRLHFRLTSSYLKQQNNKRVGFESIYLAFLSLSLLQFKFFIIIIHSIGVFLFFCACCRVFVYEIKKKMLSVEEA